MFGSVGCVTTISAGGGYTCAVTSAGAAQCWGLNNVGELGNGNTINQNTPGVVSGLTSGVVAVSAGPDYSCAVTNTGDAQCWGYNGTGALGNGTSSGVPTTTPVAVSGLSSGVVAVSAGLDYTCAVTSAGAALCWGADSTGQLGDGNNRYTRPGTDTPVAVIGLTSGVVAISAGAYHTCALTSAGGVWCWGANDLGQLGIGVLSSYSTTPVAVSGLSSGVVAISAGDGHTCAVTSAGGVWCWGSNSAGQLGTGTPTYQSLYYSTTPVAVIGLTSGVVAISAGEGHTCAVTSVGAEWCWGSNVYGQLGNGSAGTIIYAPVLVSQRAGFYNDDIPTLPEWGVILMSVGLLVTAMFRQRGNHASS